MVALFVLCQPIGSTLWSIDREALSTDLITLYAFGWALELVSTFVIDRFELFGLNPTWRSFRGKPDETSRFRQPSLYRIVRHPL